jgi:hypothetical protein
MKAGGYLFQDLITLKKIKSSVGHTNYYPNLIIVPDTSHAFIPKSSPGMITLLMLIPKALKFYKKSINSRAELPSKSSSKKRISILKI